MASRLIRSIAHASSAPNIALVDAMSLTWLLLVLLVMVVLELLSSRGFPACPAAGGSPGWSLPLFLSPPRLDAGVRRARGRHIGAARIQGLPDELEGLRAEERGEGVETGTRKVKENGGDVDEEAR